MAGGAADSDDEINGINVTPLVDITLVLLIIFMVTANMITHTAMKMDLPKAASGTESVQLILAVELAADGTTKVNQKVAEDDAAIVKEAKAQKQKDPEVRAVIRADKSVTHGRVIHVLDVLRGAGISKIAFAVSPAGAGGDGDAKPPPEK